MLEGTASRISVALSSRAAAAFQRTRYRNALLFAEAATAIRALSDAGVDTCLLKGAALAVTVYDEPALRPMSDVDILVPPTELNLAVAALQGAGFQTSSPFGPAERAEAHAAGFTNLTYGSIDLHWRSLDVAASAAGDLGLWAASRPAVLGGAATRVPAFTDLLLHACVSGQRWGADQACRWVADALAILTHPGEAVDWERFEREAVDKREAGPVAEALHYLRTLGAPVSADVPARLARGRPGLAGRLLVQARGQDPEQRGPLLAGALHYESYRRLLEGGIVPIGLLGFVRSAARTWGLRSAWQVPMHTLVRGARRLAQLLAQRAKPGRLRLRGAPGSPPPVAQGAGQRGGGPRLPDAGGGGSRGSRSPHPIRRPGNQPGG